MLLLPAASSAWTRPSMWLGESPHWKASGAGKPFVIAPRRECMATMLATATAWGCAAHWRPRRSRVVSVAAFEDEAGVQEPLGFWDPMGFTDDNDIAAYRRRRSVELKHCRVCMLATVGYIVPEAIGKWPGFLSPSMGLKFADVPNGLLALQAIPSLGLAQILVFCGLLEYTGGFEDYTTGKPGDYGLRVLVSNDPVEHKGKLNGELANGRIAMVAIMGMLFQNGLAGTTGPEMWLPGSTLVSAATV